MSEEKIIKFENSTTPFEIPSVMLYAVSSTNMVPELYNINLESNKDVKFIKQTETERYGIRPNDDFRATHTFSLPNNQHCSCYIQTKKDNIKEINYQFNFKDQYMNYQLHGRSKDLTEKEISKIAKDLEFVKNNAARIKQFTEFSKPLTDKSPLFYTFAIRELVKLEEFLNVFEEYGSKEPNPEFKEEFFEMVGGLERMHRSSKKFMPAIKTGPFELLFTEFHNRYYRHSLTEGERFILNSMRIRVGSVVIYHECGINKFKDIPHDGLNAIINYCYAIKNKKKDNFYTMISKRAIELF